jgi:hypothetical protein
MPSLVRESPSAESRYINDGVVRRRVAWAPQPGAQVAALKAPIPELLIWGNRGGGKSDTLLMMFGRFVGRYGDAWKGIVFRRTYSELSHLVSKARRWFPSIFPGSYYNKTERIFYFPGGETLKFDYFEREEDYDRHHGKEFTYIGWDELSLYPTPYGYLKMMSCLRSPTEGIPLLYRSTTNPYGAGSNWIKRRFELSQPVKGIIGPRIATSRDAEGFFEPERASIKSMLHENLALLRAQPYYEQQIRVASMNVAQLRAWLYADWNVTTGGMFDDVWSPEFSALPSIPPSELPRRWRIDRAYDHGQSRPFSVGWWAESNGEPFVHNGVAYGAVPGDLILFSEWYGTSGEDNVGLRMDSHAIAKGIISREDDMGILGRVRPGPADRSIFDDYEPNKSVAQSFIEGGVYWEKGRKGPGSRVQKWQLLRKMMLAAVPKNGVREYPGIFVTEGCRHFLRLVPVAPRSTKNYDDVDTDSEDHILDMVGYRIFRDARVARVTDW